MNFANFIRYSSNAPGSDELHIFNNDGLVGQAVDSMGDIVQNIKDGIVEIGLWIVRGLFHILTPFMNWGAKAVVVICIIVFFASGDKKAISKGIVTVMMYILFFMLEGVVMP